jgi:hypothetical protein
VHQLIPFQGNVKPSIANDVEKLRSEFILLPEAHPDTKISIEALILQPVNIQIIPHAWRTQQPMKIVVRTPYQQ